MNSFNDSFKNLGEFNMGASDPYLFPQYEAYARYYLENYIKKSKKIAWLGLQHPYRISKFFEILNSAVENHCFDIVPQGDPQYCHKLDLNESGYGQTLNQQGFSIITVLRVSFYMNDHEKTIKEFKDFLNNDKDKLVWFEDEDPQLEKGPEPSTYHGVNTIKTKRQFTKSLLEKHFSIKNYHRIYGPDGVWYDQYCLFTK